MIGKSLQSWFKEFGTLVFTQTIQAFIYAIIISIVTYSMDSSKISGASAVDENGALGMLSVIALASIFKVEALLRKILGIGESKANVKGAMGSIAKTAIALKMGQRVLNNGVKMIGGQKDRWKGNRDLKKARTKGSEDQEEANKTYDNKVKQIESDDKYQHKYDDKLTAEENAAKAKQKEDLQKAKLGEAEIAKKRQYKAIASELKTKSEEIAKTRREGTKKIWSGGLETIGAAVGGTMGAIIGGADGDLGEAGQGFLAGMGIGDIAGEKVVNVASSSIDATNSMKKGLSKYVASINKQLDADIGVADKKNFANAFKQAHSSYNKTKKEVNQLQQELDRMSKADDAN